MNNSDIRNNSGYKIIAPLPPSIRIIVSLFHCCASLGGSYSKWIHINGIPLPSLPRHFVRWICNVPWTNFSRGDERWKKKKTARNRATAENERGVEEMRAGARYSRAIATLYRIVDQLWNNRPLSDSLIIYSILTKHCDRGYTEIRIHCRYCESSSLRKSVTFPKIFGTRLLCYIFL